MNNLVPRLEKLELNLIKLIHRMKLLEEENKSLKDRNSSLEHKLNEAKEELATLDISGATALTADKKKEISSKIDDYVAEIDACIDFLKADQSESE